MPLPTAWHPLRHVGASGGDRSRPVARADAQISRAFRCCQSTNRETRHPILPEIRCCHVRRLPQGTHAASMLKAPACCGTRQCSISSRHPAARLSGETARYPLPLVPAALQPGLKSGGTGLEACKKAVYSQSVLPITQGSRSRGFDSAGALEKTKPSAGQTMRHYLRRCV